MHACDAMKACSRSEGDLGEIESTPTDRWIARTHVHALGYATLPTAPRGSFCPARRCCRPRGPAPSASAREPNGPVASTQHTGFWPRCALCVCAPCGESARAACARGRRRREPKGCCACDAVLCRMPDAKKVAIASASCVSFHVSATHCVMHALRRAVGAISSGLVLSACLEKGLPCGGVLCSL